MKAKVTKAYTDRLDGVVRLPGESAELAAGGYVEPVAAAQAPEKAGKPDYDSMED